MSNKVFYCPECDEQLESNEAANEILSLEAEVKILREVAEFYGDKFNWRTNTGKIGVTPLTDGSDTEIIDGQITGGKFARDGLRDAQRLQSI